MANQVELLFSHAFYSPETVRVAARSLPQGSAVEVEEQNEHCVLRVTLDDSAQETALWQMCNQLLYDGM